MIVNLRHQGVTTSVLQPMVLIPRHATLRFPGWWGGNDQVRVNRCRGDIDMLTNLIIRAQNALADRKGVTAAEYAVLAVGIVIVVAGAALLLGRAISGTFSKVIGAL